jgi:two-component system chemotaxis response regulator CheB
MPALLESLVQQPVGEPAEVPEGIKLEVEIARGEGSTMKHMDRIGHRSVLACPDCHGVMWEINEGELTRYRCHVGHTYTADMMAVALDENVRRALGSGLRALEERVALAQKLEEQAKQSGHRLSSATWSSKAREAEKELDVLRNAMKRIDDMAGAEELKRAG